MHGDYNTGNGNRQCTRSILWIPYTLSGYHCVKTLSLQLSYPTADEIKADWVVFSGKVTKGNKGGAYYVTFWSDNRLIMVLRTDFNGTFSYKFTRLPAERSSNMNVTVYAVDSDGRGVSNIISKVISPP